jgi:SpoVK/Ycf46/Vps4 family AAA+-type ATPase
MPDDALAERRSPDFGWGDLKLPPHVLSRLRKFSERLCGREPGGGLSALFLGPDEAGAKRAAEMIAIAAGLEIHQIGLSSIVSKYIGETEKDIGRIFAAAGAAGALLFFDEADALFGKRAEIKDAHARYAEADFFLRRIRDHAGATIVAMRGPPADDALFRRFSLVALFDFCA